MQTNKTLILLIGGTVLILLLVGGISYRLGKNNQEKTDIAATAKIFKQQAFSNGALLPITQGSSVVLGTVTQVTGGGLSLRLKDGTTHAYALSTTTLLIKRNNQTDPLKVGDVVTIVFRKNAQGILVIQYAQIHPPAPVAP